MYNGLSQVYCIKAEVYKGLEHSGFIRPNTVSIHYLPVSEITGNIFSGDSFNSLHSNIQLHEVIRLVPTCKITVQYSPFIIDLVIMVMLWLQIFYHGTEE